MTARDVARFDEMHIAEPNTGCLLWIGRADAKGYGLLWTGSTTARAHRFAWQRIHGPIPDGLCICHHCDTPACVNTDHLFLGTVADNNHDMARKGRARSPLSDRTHCPHGHPYSGANVRTYVWAQDGRRRRSCVACSKTNNAKRRALAKGAQPAREHGNRRAFCHRRHELAASNLILRSNGGRECAACSRLRGKARYERVKLAANTQHKLLISRSELVVFPDETAALPGEHPGSEARI